MSLPSDPGDPTDPGSGGGTSGGSPPAPSAYGSLIFDALVVPKKDADSWLEIICYLTCACTDDLRFSSYIFIDDNLVQVGTTNQIFDNFDSQAQGTMTIVAMVQNIAAGNRTVTVRVKNRDDGTLSILPGSILKVVELRHAAR